MEPVDDTNLESEAQLQHEQLSILVDFHNLEIEDLSGAFDAKQAVSRRHEQQIELFILRNCKPELIEADSSAASESITDEALSGLSAAHALNEILKTYRQQHSIEWFRLDGIKQFIQTHQYTRHAVADLLQNRYRPYIHEGLNALQGSLGDGQGWGGLYDVLNRVGRAIHDGFELILRERFLSPRKRLLVKQCAASECNRTISLLAPTAVDEEYCGDNCRAKDSDLI